MTTTNSLGQARHHDPELEADPCTFNRARLRVASISFKRVAPRREYAEFWNYLTRNGYRLTRVDSGARYDERALRYGEGPKQRVLVVRANIRSISGCT